MEEIYANDDNDTPEDKRPSTYKTDHLSAWESSAEFSVIKANLSESLQAIDNQLSTLNTQRDLLKVVFAEMTKELTKLQKRTCPPGWKTFHCSCYLFSTQEKSWEESRQDCRARGADLVVIESLEEQKFLSSNIKAHSWIGLSDRDNEGTWKWTDGTLLAKAYWWSGQPDNVREEDCGQARINLNEEGNWNDLRCELSCSWICEKLA
ncbi:CD209 antigen-like protein C [Notolabrus celidotus]|uniref:CD209 antigen-like protein C n=1 Tax=Notolabrus celidotus TaxID=1203425 RepID=UPI00148FD5C7|nr:CD209 antigen-like protein C [Notolabrus celidotus]